MNTPTEAKVLAAADAIVTAFAATDTDAYFAGFAPEATFVFHPESARLESRAEYETLWAEWLASGWRVVSCASSQRRVQAFPGGAVFSHTVATSVHTADGPESYIERESIIFRCETDDALVAIHEHLSTTPEGTQS
jgi:ketosteroid isomerase-like protein